MLYFHIPFPDIAPKESRSLLVRPESNLPLPVGDYLFTELYCVARSCDCRRVLFHVYQTGGSRHEPAIAASINYAFEPQSPQDVLMVGPMPQAFLDPINPQGPHAAALLDIFLRVVLTSEYKTRLQRHYRLVKDALLDPDHLIQQYAGENDRGSVPLTRRRSAPGLAPRSSKGKHKKKDRVRRRRKNRKK